LRFRLGNIVKNYLSKLNNLERDRFRALAIFLMLRMVMFFSALSIIPIYVLCIPAISASFSWERFLLALSSLTLLPNCMSMSFFMEN